MKKTLFVASLVAALVAQAGILDRPSGIKIGQRMTIRPYVSLYYTWDSNVDSTPSAKSASSFVVNPGLTLAYRADNWSIEGGAYYQYHAYTENARNLNQGSWGENLAFNWTNSKDGGRGWTLVLRESLQQISQDDDMMNDGGRGVGRDRMQIQFAGTLERRFSERWHGDIDASYYFLNYDNDKTAYAPMYGWQRWTAGAQGGYVLSKWTDLILAGTYQGYSQNNDQIYGLNAQDISPYSHGWTVQGGLGSYATERISYRVTGGFTQFRYSSGKYVDNAFTYAVSGHWRMSDTWNMMILASSWYQPSESQYATGTRVDSVSWGIAHSMVRNKLTATFDLAYRHEKNNSYAVESNSYSDNILTARLGLNYSLNRFLSIFGNAEYQTAFYNGRGLDYTYGGSADWDYNRWRLSVGLRLTY